jgi:hypothetical protein
MSRTRKVQPELFAATGVCARCNQPIYNPRGGLWLHVNPGVAEQTARTGWTFCATNPAVNLPIKRKYTATPKDAG